MATAGVWRQKRKEPSAPERDRNHVHQKPKKGDVNAALVAIDNAKRAYYLDPARKVRDSAERVLLDALYAVLEHMFSTQRAVFVQEDLPRGVFLNSELAKELKQIMQEFVNGPNFQDARPDGGRKSALSVASTIDNDDVAQALQYLLNMPNYAIEYPRRTQAVRNTEKAEWKRQNEWLDDYFDRLQELKLDDF